MGLTNEILFEYGRDENGNISIIGDTPKAHNTFDADQNYYMQQRGFQDSLTVSIRQEVGIPANKLSAWWYEADAAKILPTIAKLEDPRHMMLALHSASDFLPSGMDDMLAKIGVGSPELRTSLQAALRNPQFRASLATQTGGELLTKGLSILQGSDKELTERFGLDKAAINSIIDKVGIDIFTRIGEGEFNGRADRLEGAISQSVITTAVSHKLDSIVAKNSNLTNLVDVIKADPALMQSIGRAYLSDPTVKDGLGTMLEGNAGIDMARLEKIFSDPLTGAASRKLFGDVLDVVGAKEEFTFSHVLDLTEQLEAKDFAGVSASLTAMGVQPPAALANAQSFGAIQQMIHKFGQTEMGATVLGFLKDALGPGGFLGELLQKLGMGDMANQILGMFQAPAVTTGEGLAAAPDVATSHRAAVTPVVVTPEQRAHLGGYAPAPEPASTLG